MQAPPQIETPRMIGERIGPEHHAPLLALPGDPRVVDDLPLWAGRGSTFSI